MATSYQVAANGEVYTVVDAAKTAYWAVITGAATDEIFTKLDAPGFAVELKGENLDSIAFSDGTYAITAYVEQSFPNLATTSYPVSYVVKAPGFRDFPVSLVIPAGTSLPFAAPATAMRRLPVRIQGRIVNGSARTPIAGATVVSIDPTVPPAVHTMALRSPLYFKHASGVSVQQVTIATSGSAVLQKDVTGGDKVLNLSTRSGLAAGSLVRLQAPAGVRVEYAVVDHLGPGAAASPGEVFLRHMLNRSYGQATTALDFVTATPAGASVPMSAPVYVGEGILLAPKLFSGTVGVDLGAADEEIHEVGAVSDSDGFYGFDGVTAVKEILLHASGGVLQQTADWFVQYDREINLVNFRL